MKHTIKPSIPEEAALQEVKKMLTGNRKGMTISEISTGLGTNRSATLSILNLMVGSGEISMRTYGRAKVYTLSQKIPIARLLSLSLDLFLIVDEELYIEDYNESFASFFEISEDIRGSNIEYTSIPNYFDLNIIPAMQEAKEGNKRIFEGYVGPDDEKLYFRISCIPIQENDFSTKVALVLHDYTIHKKYEEELERNLKIRTDELRMSTNRFQILTDLAPVGIYETDCEGKCIYVNQKWCDITGLTPEESIGTGWEQAIHPEERDWIKNLWYEHAREEIPWNHSYRFQKKDGTVLHILGIAIALRDEEGKVTGYLGTNIDLTDRVEAEQIIQNLNTRLSSIVESAYDGIATVDTDRRFLSCNKAGCELLGYSESDLIGQSVQILFPSFSQFLDNDSIIVNRLSQNGHYRDTTKIITKDGAERVTEISVSQIISGNDFLGLIIIFRDVTDKFYNDTKVMQHEGELRSILDGFIDTVGVMDKDGTILYANPSASYYLSGSHSEDVIGRNISEFVPKNQKKLLIPIYRKVIKSQKPLSRTLTVSLRGTDTTFLNRLIPIQFGQDKVPAVLSMSLDYSMIDDANLNKCMSE